MTAFNRTMVGGYHATGTGFGRGTLWGPTDCEPQCAVVYPSFIVSGGDFGGGVIDGLPVGYADGSIFYVTGPVITAGAVGTYTAPFTLTGTLCGTYPPGLDPDAP